MIIDTHIRIVVFEAGPKAKAKAPKGGGEGLKGFEGFFKALSAVA